MSDAFAGYRWQDHVSVVGRFDIAAAAFAAVVLSAAVVCDGPDGGGSRASEISAPPRLTAALAGEPGARPLVCATPAAKGPSGPARASGRADA